MAKAKIETPVTKEVKKYKFISNFSGFGITAKKSDIMELSEEIFIAISKYKKLVEVK